MSLGGRCPRGECSVAEQKSAGGMRVIMSGYQASVGGGAVTIQAARLESNSFGGITKPRSCCAS